MTDQLRFITELNDRHSWDPVTLDDLSSISEKKLVSLLKQTYFVPEEDIIKAAIAAGICERAPENIFPDPTLQSKWSYEMCTTHRFLPLYETKDYVCIGVDNPLSDVSKYVETESKDAKKMILKSSRLDMLLSRSRSESTATDTHILDLILKDALEKDASDIHVTRVGSFTHIQYRIHGELAYQHQLSGDDQRAFLSLIKYHAHMDISRSLIPQDGRLTWDLEGQTRYVRVASLPTAHGEDFVLRLMSSEERLYDLTQLGLSKEPLAIVRNTLDQKSGLILVTGPTGTGKTNTLYAMLTYLKTHKNKSIVTLEDPVEAVIPGIRQSQINPKSGYTFSSGLRAVLRQDPDIILIGEIRDRETAEMALEAAYTGHLVLASLHTASCYESILRLKSLGLDPFLIDYALKLVMSQQLIPVYSKEDSTIVARRLIVQTLQKNPESECPLVQSKRWYSDQLRWEDDEWGTGDVYG